MSEFASVSSLPLLGGIAVHANREYRALWGAGSDPVTLYMGRSEWESFESRDEVSRGTSGDLDLWVRVVRGSISRLFTRKAMASWFDIEVSIVAPLDSETVLVWFDGDPQRAEARGMTGSQFESWWADVPFVEFSSVRIEEA
ncbi:MAG: hypothetical protein HGA44_08040 [Cellulomonadaceae bacterium]|nr:hypothetical protein [Cellulomonadaceae bacterium]